MGAVKRAMVAGNYHKQKGLGFGGFDLSDSAKSLIRLVADELKVPSAASDIILIDVHTGLGPYGVDTLITDFPSPPSISSSNTNANTNISMEEIIEEIFPIDKDGGLKVSVGSSASNKQAKDVGDGYELTIGTVTKHFCEYFLAPQLNGSNRICIAQVCYFSINIFSIFRTLKNI
jgi:hypothetical protein